MCWLNSTSDNYRVSMRTQIQHKKPKYKNTKKENKKIIKT